MNEALTTLTVLYFSLHAEIIGAIMKFPYKHLLP